MGYKLWSASHHPGNAAVMPGFPTGVMCYLEPFLIKFDGFARLPAVGLFIFWALAFLQLEQLCQVSA